MQDFEPFAAYQTIVQYDRSAYNEQVLNISALKKFLEVNNSKQNYELLARQDGYWHQLLRYQFKTASPFQISYTEFLRTILPVRKKKLRDRVLKKQQIRTDGSLEAGMSPIIKSKMLFAIAQIIDQSIRMHAELMDYRYRLASQHTKSSKQSLQAIR